MGCKVGVLKDVADAWNKDAVVENFEIVEGACCGEDVLGEGFDAFCGGGKLVYLVATGAFVVAEGFVGSGGGKLSDRDWSGWAGDSELVGDCGA